MSKLESTTPKTVATRNVALYYAGVLTVLALSQLFSFEKFVPLVASFGIVGEGTGAYVLSVAIVASEVLALPFLLRMQVSVSLKWVSMVCGWLVSALWTMLALWHVFSPGVAENSGFLGASIIVPSGWWLVFISLALGVLAAWASWGLWPGDCRSKTRHTLSKHKK